MIDAWLMESGVEWRPVPLPDGTRITIDPPAALGAGVWYIVDGECLTAKEWADKRIKKQSFY